MTFESGIVSHIPVAEASYSSPLISDKSLSRHQYWRLESDVKPHVGMSDEEAGLIKLDFLTISSEMSNVVDGCILELQKIDPEIRCSTSSNPNPCQINSQFVVAVLQWSEINSLESTIGTKEPIRNEVTFCIAVVALDQGWNAIDFDKRQSAIAIIRRIGFVPLFCPPCRRSPNDGLAMTVLSLSSLPFIKGMPCLDHYQAAYLLSPKKTSYAIARFVGLSNTESAYDFSHDVEPDHNSVIAVIWTDDKFELDQYLNIYESIELHLNDDASFESGTKAMVSLFQAPFRLGISLISLVPV